MQNKGTDFPQYRKLSNDKAFYKIISEREFEEVQLIGTTAKLHHVVAGKYPEMLRIQDLLSLGEWYLHSSEEEFLQMKNLCNS